MSANLMQSNQIVQQLATALGPEHVLTDAGEREFHAMDVYNAREVPIAVVRPGSVADLQAVVRTAAAAGIALVARGGGASYTDGYLPTTPDSVLVDTSRMNRIIEINEEDMYVTVQPGVTWNDMWQALKARGLRTPFWGPFSGIKATVGGSASQNSASLGSGNFGVSADAILGFEIVLASGEILRTGAHAAANGTPFFRWYGPDLTGLFCGDAGALGIKASISLRLIKDPPHSSARRLLASIPSKKWQRPWPLPLARMSSLTASGWIPRLQQGQLSKASAKDAMTAALAVAKTARNPLEGVCACSRWRSRASASSPAITIRRITPWKACRGRRSTGKLALLRQVMARPWRGDRQHDSHGDEGHALHSPVPDPGARRASAGCRCTASCRSRG